MTGMWWIWLLACLGASAFFGHRWPLVLLPLAGIWAND